MSDLSPTDSVVSAPPVQPLAQATLREAPASAMITPEKAAAQTRVAVRIWCGFLFVLSAGMLAMGLYLRPSSQGVGTHQELGLPPCGFMATTGFPCPTCGCTTSVSHFAHGHVVSSFLTQPFGFTVALVATLLVPLTFLGLITGKWMGPSTFWLGWRWHWWVFGTVGILTLAWVYKILSVRGHWGW